MRFSCVVAILVVAGLAVFLAGCGGGGGGSSLHNTGVELAIGTDVTPDLDKAETRAPVDLETSLNAGAQVTVYNFETGDVVATGQIGANGLCTVIVPPGITVAVVVTGKHDGKDYRLSTIIPSVPQDGTTEILSPTTSLAAEAIAQMAFSQNLTVAEEDWQAVLEAAQQYASDNPETDYSLGDGTVFTGAPGDPEEFGKPEGLDEEEVQEVIDAVPEETYNEVAAAKRAVKQIREAGVPLKDMLSMEMPDLEGVFTEAVAEKYSALADRLALLALPALFDEFYLDDTSSYVGLSDLEPGHVYGIEPEEGWMLAEITDGEYYQPETGKVVILAYDEFDDVVYRAVASKSGSVWTIVQTSEADPDLLYTITVTDIDSIPAANPTATLTANLADGSLEDSIVFDGTVSAVGSSRNSYTKITVVGELTSENIESGGTFEANFPAAKPAGAEADDTTYQYPTSFHSENAHVAFTNEGTTIALTGRISANMTTLSTPEGPQVVPNRIELEGGYINNHSGLDFQGSIIGNWPNPAWDPNPTQIVGTLVLDGRFTREGRLPYQANLEFSLNNGAAACDIDLQLGASTLTGRVSAQLRDDQHPLNATLTLTDQADVVFALAAPDGLPATGTITKGTDEAATITVAENLIRIDYNDDEHSFEEFPL